MRIRIQDDMSRNYGDQFVDSVREYMKANDIKTLGGVNGTLLADLAQRFHEKFTKSEKTVKRQKVQLASEEEWLKSIESDPAMKGVDVRRELGRCQFWCSQQRPAAICTRRRFQAWLLKSDSRVQFTYDGASSRPVKTQAHKPNYTPETPVPGWPLLLRTVIFTSNEELVEADRLCAGDWAELPLEIREKIIAVA